jgi:phage terminase Nu1 subunit (DNA packaging protein)
MPNLLTKAAFARRLGVDRAYVTRLAQAGRLVLTRDGKRVRVAASLQLVKETEGAHGDAVKAYHARQRKKPKQGKGGRAVETPDIPVNENGGSEAPDDEAKSTSRAYWDRRAAAAQAKMRELELEKLTGDLIAREDVRFILADLGALWRTSLSNMAARLAPLVTPLTTVAETETTINDFRDEIERELMETLRQRHEGLKK